MTINLAPAKTRNCINTICNTKIPIDTIVCPHCGQKYRRAALFARVASTEQTLNGDSIASQVKRLQDYCDKTDLTIVNLYTFVGRCGYPCEITKTYQYQRYIQEVESRKFDVLLVTNFNRISRSLETQMKEAKFLENNNIEFRSIEHETNPKVLKNLLRCLHKTFYQHEKEMISENIKRGIRAMKEKALQT